MDAIKLATPEQIEKIRATADLPTIGAVLAMGEDLAVIKQVTELDPVYFAETSNTSRRLMFIWGIENYLRLTGVDRYYFDVPVDAETWRHNVETHGAEQLSTGAVYHYKKVLISANQTADNK